MSWKLTIVATLMLLALTEVIVRTDWFWSLSPTSPAQQPYEVWKLALGGGQPPEVIAIGNSIFRDAISPVQVRDTLNLPERAIANASITAGMMTTLNALYSEHRSQMRETGLLIIGVEPRQFDNTRSVIPGTQIVGPAKGVPERFRRGTNLKQRWMIEEGRAERISLLMGWFWATWDHRDQLRLYGEQLIKQARIDAEDLRVDTLGRIQAKPNLFPPPSDWLPGDAHNQAKGYKFIEGVEFDAFRRLITKAKDDGLRIMLLQPPFPDSWLSEYKATAGDEYQVWHQAVERLAGVKIEVVEFPGDVCSVYSRCYSDGTHLNQVGAIQYSTALAEWLIEAYPGIVN